MAKIIGESNSTGIIRYNFLRYNIKDFNLFEGIRQFKDSLEIFLENKEQEDHYRQELQNKVLKKEILRNLITKKYYGALGEQKVINTLRALPDTYYVLNEIRIRLTKSVLWKKYFEYVKSAQIDHVVIGDTGIFLIETKNWKEMNLTSVHNSPHKQIDRAGMLFWLAQKKKFGQPYKTYKLVVTIKDLPKYKYKHVYQLLLKELNEFILSRTIGLNFQQIENIKNWLVKLRRINPKSRFWSY